MYLRLHGFLILIFCSGWVHGDHGDHRVIMLIRHLAERMPRLMELHSIIIAYCWLLKYHVATGVFSPVRISSRSVVVGSGSSLARMPCWVWFMFMLHVARLLLSAHKVLGLVKGRDSRDVFFLTVFIFPLFVQFVFNLRNIIVIWIILNNTDWKRLHTIHMTCIVCEIRVKHLRTIRVHRLLAQLQHFLVWCNVFI